MAKISLAISHRNFLNSSRCPRFSVILHGVYRPRAGLSTVIKFGTSGWRGIVGRDFNFDGVRAATQAIAEQLRAGEVVVGHDPRYLSPEFAAAAAEILAANGLKVWLTKRDVPTPAVAFEIIRRKTAGGINFTASHNPSEWNGLKFSPATGGPAMPEQTKPIEARAAEILARRGEVRRMALDQSVREKRVAWFDARPAFLRRLSSLVDLKAMRRAGLKIVVDALHGAGRDYTDELLRKGGCRVTALHQDRHVLFGGMAPDPSPASCRVLIKEVKRQKAHLGLATDGDADRFGVFDRDGTFLWPNQVLALLLEHLIVTRKWRAVVARSVVTTSLLDAIAASHGLEIRETPVGFKYIAEVMAKERMIIGGEESGGLTILGHVPEKDGVLACALVAELAAVRRKSLRDLLKELYRRHGPVVSTRVDLHLDPARMDGVRARVAAWKQDPPRAVGDWPVERAVTVDGVKLYLRGGAWAAFRLSGTEPVARIYIEARRGRDLAPIARAGEKLLTT